MKSTSATSQEFDILCAERKLTIPVGGVLCDRDGLDENVVSDRRDREVLDRRAAVL